MAVPQIWIFVALSAVAIAAAVWWVLRRRYYQLGSKIPGPRLLQLFRKTSAFVPRRQGIMAFYKKLCDRYGPVCKVWLGPYLVVVLADSKDITVIFNSSRTLSKSPAYRSLNLVLGKSMLTADATEWNKLRRIMDPAFSRHAVCSYISTFCEKSRVMADLLDKHCDERPFDVAKYVMRCMFDIANETSLGVLMDLQGADRQHTVIENLEKLVELVSQVFLSPWLWLDCIRKFSHIHRELLKLFKGIDSFVISVVNQKFDEYLQSEGNNSTKHKVNYLGTNSPKQPSGLLEHMISTMANNPGLLTVQNVRDQTKMILAASVDTTAFTTSHTLMLLGLHQEVQRKVMKEQEAIFGQDVHRPVTAEDLQKMVYLEQVINESMRLYPVVPIVSRWVEEEVTINNYILPARTTVVIPIYLVHRDPTLYPDPLKFYPERFNKENIISRPTCSYIPFVSGRRNCLGWRYSYLVMKTMLSVLLRRYQVLEHGSTESMEQVEFEFLLKLTNGYNIKLRAREFGSK